MIIPVKSSRLISLDLLRGFIMILMALDHASVFIARRHYTEFWGTALPEYHDNAVFFLNRFITHLCAPGFAFLMGTGMVLFAANRLEKSWTTFAIRKHFLIRGVVLLLCLIFLEGPAWGLGFVAQNSFTSEGMMQGTSGTAFLMLPVLFTLSASMILSSLWINASIRTLFLISVVSIALPQVVIPYLDTAANYHPLLRVLFIAGKTGIVASLYPIMPWLGICGLGMIFGRCIRANSKMTFSLVLPIGISLILLFFILKLADIGSFYPLDSSNWISFMSITKYPPSLTFICWTLGINFMVLALFHYLQNVTWLQKIFLPFGLVAFFFYIAHLYCYALLGYAFPDGASMPVFYGMWLLGLVILYPFCTWYGRFKQKTAPNSLWRLF